MKRTLIVACLVMAGGMPLTAGSESPSHDAPSNGGQAPLNGGQANTRNAATARIVAAKTITVDADPVCQALIEFDAVEGDDDLWNSTEPSRLTAKYEGWYLVSYNYSVIGSSFVQGNFLLLDARGRLIDGGFHGISASIFGHTNGFEAVHMRRGDSVQGVVCISGGPGGTATLTRARLSLVLR